MVKQHKLIMRPAGCSIMPRTPLIPDDAKWVGSATEASLIGTLYKDNNGIVQAIKGLLAAHKTFFIEDASAELVNNDQLYIVLKAGWVDKRTALGRLEYKIKAKLIIACQPFIPSHKINQLFEIVNYEPSYVTAMKIEQ